MRTSIAAAVMAGALVLSPFASAELIKNGGHCYNGWYYNTSTGRCQEGSGGFWILLGLGVAGFATYRMLKD